MIQQAPSGLPPPLPRGFPMAPLKRSPVRAEANEKQRIAHSRRTELQQWKVNELVSLPSMHRLERTNVYVDGTAQEVATRICECLQRESIAASFPDEDQVRFESCCMDCHDLDIVVLQKLTYCLSPRCNNRTD